MVHDVPLVGSRQQSIKRESNGSVPRAPFEILISAPEQPEDFGSGFRDAQGQGLGFWEDFTHLRATSLPSESLGFQSAGAWDKIKAG